MIVGKHHAFRRRAVIGLLVAASIALLTLSFRPGSSDAITTVQRATMSVTEPFSAAAHRVSQPFVDAWGWAAGLVDARQQNERLKRELAQAGNLQVQNAEYRARLQRLSALLAFKQQVTWKSVAGTVIAQSPTSYTSRITLDVGRSDGVRVDDPVVAPAGQGGALIGRVDQVSANASSVVLLLDRTSAVTGRVQSQRSAWGIVQPSAGDPGQLNLSLVPVSVDVPAGGVVVTAGLDDPRGRPRLRSVLPAGLPIGRITSVGQSDTSQFHTIQVTPFVDFQNVSDVLVLEVRH